jgi:hypothetical protein
MTKFFDVVNQHLLVVARAADGSAVTGKVAADFTLYYRKSGVGALVQVTPLSDLAAITTAHTDGGIKELSSTNAPGAYRLDPPDAAFVSGAGDNVSFHVKVAGAVDIHLDIELVNAVTIGAGGVMAANAVQISGDSAAADALEALFDTGFAASVRAALGLASANTDTQLASLSSGQTTINNNVLTVAARLIALAVKTGTVVADGSNSATTFKTDMTETSNEHWKESFILITSGTLTGAARKIDGFVAATDFVTVTPAFPSTPANGVTFAIINR